MVLSCEKTCEVKVIHGANDDSFQLAGKTVGNVRSSLVDAFNIPPNGAIAFVNDVQVDMDYLLEGGETLEFCKQYGQKGIERMLTEEAIRREYVGIPKDVLDEMFQHFAHDDQNTDRERVWLESAVDGWIRDYYSRNRADDGRDMVIPPKSVRLSGQTYHDFTNFEWRILEAVLQNQSQEGVGVAFDVVIEHVWGHDAGWKDDAMKQHIKRINSKLSEQRCAAVIEGANRFVTIVK